MIEFHTEKRKIVWRYNRWHHEVDYSKFRNNKPIFKQGIKLEDKVNNYGLKVVKNV